VVLGVLAVGLANVVVATVRDINEQPGHKKAEAWLHHAEQELGPHPTKEEAIDSLQRSGAVWELEKKGDRRWRPWYQVVGRRSFGERTFWKRPIEAELLFSFWPTSMNVTLTTEPTTH
jgi:hypothetical protein